MASGFRDWWQGSGRNTPGRRPRPGGSRPRQSAPAGASKAWAHDSQGNHCPVSEPQRRWTEERLWWCVQEFGRDVARRRVVVPELNFYPADYDGSEAKARQLVVRVCMVMCVDPASVTVEFYDTAPEKARKRHAIGTYRKVNGENRISLDRAELADAERLTGVIAHELAHKRLLGEKRGPNAFANSERMTDLLTVFLGMGVFTANDAVRFPKSEQGWTALPMGDLTDRMLNAATNEGWSTVGYLNETELGFALAGHCLLRDESEPPPWSWALKPGPRAALLQGLRYYAARPPRA